MRNSACNAVANTLRNHHNGSDPSGQSAQAGAGGPFLKPQLSHAISAQLEELTTVVRGGEVR